jgi:hypothetical protein
LEIAMDCIRRGTEVKTRRGELRQLGPALERFGAETITAAAREAGTSVEELAAEVGAAWSGTPAELQHFRRLVATPEVHAREWLGAEAVAP